MADRQRARAMRHDLERTIAKAHLTPKQGRMMKRYGDRCYGHGYSAALEHTRDEMQRLIGLLEDKEDEVSD